MAEMVGTSLDRYEIVELLGEGGMGAVYKARDVTLQRDVAIKVMHPHIARQADFKVRFLQEARTAAKLDHPGIVQVYDFNQTHDRLYIVMKLIAGANLRQMLEDLKAAGKWVPLDEAVQLVRQISLALDYAHRRGVLHRDIKPKNIMIEPGSGNSIAYHPVITDLGLAKLAEGGIETRQGSSMGTPAYMSPEQALGQKTDARSDVYSLGILLYELSVGRVPFPAKTITEAIHYHTTEVPPTPHSIRPGLPQSLERIILQALEKEPAKRLPDAAALASALEGIASAIAGDATASTTLDSTISLITQYQQSLAKPRGPSILKEFDTPADLNHDTIQVMVQGKTIGSWVVKGEETTIGRSEDNDIVLEDVRASRYHARVVFDGTAYQISDLNSRNGTFMANTRLLPGVPEVWTPDKPLRIGGTWLRLVRAQQPASGGVSVSNGTVADTREIRTSAGVGWVSVLMETTQLTVKPGMSLPVTVVVLNQGPLVDHFQVTVDGIPSDWVSIPPLFIHLLPGQQQAVKLIIQPPLSPQSRVGQYPLTIRATSQSDPRQLALISATLTVTAYYQYSLTMRPQRQNGVTEGDFSLEISNQCNTDLTFKFDAIDIEDGCQYTFDSSQLVIHAGEEQPVQLKVRPKAPLRSEIAKPYPFTVTVQTAEAPGLIQQGQGIWVQSPPVYKLSLQPQTQSGMAKGVFTLQVINVGQADFVLQLEALDAEAGCLYDFIPSRITVPVGQEVLAQLEVLPKALLASKEARTYPFTVTARPVEIPGFILQVQGEWVHISPRIDLDLHPPEQNGEMEGVFSVNASNGSESDVTLQWEAVGLDDGCSYTFEPLQSTVPAGAVRQVTVKIRAKQPLSETRTKTHTFTINARLANAPKVFWKVDGKWNQITSQAPISPRPVTPPAVTPQPQPASPTVSGARRFWGCAVMLLGVVATIAFGILVGNIIYEVFDLSDNEIWIFVIIAWVVGILVTRGLARKIMKR